MTRLELDDPVPAGVVEATERTETSRSWLVVLVVALALAPIVVSVAFGAFGLVRNDDWAWAEILWRWEHSGQLRLNGWPSMFLIGQLVLAWPVARIFPDSLRALELWTVATGVVGILAAYWTMRQFLSARRATLACALLLVSPLYAPLAMSFMTDVPAFAAQACALALGVKALKATTTARLATFASLSFAVGIVAFTIREYAIVAPASVALVLVARALARRSPAEFWAVVAPGAILAGLAVWLLSLRLAMHGSLTFKPSASSMIDGFGSDFGRSVLYTLVTLAFLVLPTFAFVPIRPLIEKITAARWRIVVAAAFIAAGAAGLAGGWRWSPPLLSPYLDERGTFGTDVTPGVRATLFPDLLFKALLALVILATVLVVVVIASAAARAIGPRRQRRATLASADARSVLVVFVIGSLVAIVAVGTSDLPIFDRYLLAAVPFAAALVLDTAPAAAVATSAQRTLRWLAVAAFAFIGLVWTSDSAAFDAARWRAGEDAVATGVPADRVDAGFEWRDTFRLPGQLVLTPSQPDPDACVVMSVTEPGATPPSNAVVDVTWSSVLGRRGHIVGVPVDAPDCPPLP